MSFADKNVLVISFFYCFELKTVNKMEKIKKTCNLYFLPRNVFFVMYNGCTTTIRIERIHFKSCKISSSVKFSKRDRENKSRQFDGRLFFKLYFLMAPYFK